MHRNQTAARAPTTAAAAVNLLPGGLKKKEKTREGRSRAGDQEPDTQLCTLMPEGSQIMQGLNRLGQNNLGHWNNLHRL